MPILQPAIIRSFNILQLPSFLLQPSTVLLQPASFNASTNVNSFPSRSPGTSRQPSASKAMQLGKFSCCSVEPPRWRAFSGESRTSPGCPTRVYKGKHLLRRVNWLPEIVDENRLNTLKSTGFLMTQISCKGRPVMTNRLTTGKMFRQKIAGRLLDVPRKLPAKPDSFLLTKDDDLGMESSWMS